MSQTVPVQARPEPKRFMDLHSLAAEHHLVQTLWPGASPPSDSGYYSLLVIDASDDVLADVSDDLHLRLVNSIQSLNVTLPKTIDAPLGDFAWACWATDIRDAVAVSSIIRNCIAETTVPLTFTVSIGVSLVSARAAAEVGGTEGIHSDEKAAIEWQAIKGDADTKVSVPDLEAYKRAQRSFLDKWAKAPSETSSTHRDECAAATD
ncbi:MAG: hypothetical protein KDA90_23365 [Planctomycetaceae bacterium]|nr:hypothetical protein [Planctomycetaceae bacterium]